MSAKIPPARVIGASGTLEGMQGGKGLLNSRKGLFALLLVAAASTFVIIRIMEVVQWADYTVKIFGLFIGGHAVQEATTAIANRPKAPLANNVAGPSTVVVNQPEVSR